MEKKYRVMVMARDCPAGAAEITAPMSKDKADEERDRRVADGLCAAIFAVDYNGGALNEYPKS